MNALIYLLQLVFVFNLANSASLSRRRRYENIVSFDKTLSDKERAVITLHQKRGLYFGHMITCETGRSFFDYIDYGCFCGLGGGGKPVDELDNCCKNHDNCYGDLIDNKICKLEISTYTITFKYHGCSQCAEPSEYTWWDGFGYENVKCRKALCDCDAAAAKCFKRAGYNNHFHNYDQDKC